MKKPKRYEIETKKTFIEWLAFFRKQNINYYLIAC